ncbi:hypothetical protein VR43_07435 [Streptomyces sp. NRRL S-104]|nr:hypothetical protein VR43_07435 [Streptomyces sp. NRRL S-104]
MTWRGWNRASITMTLEITPSARLRQETSVRRSGTPLSARNALVRDPARCSYPPCGSATCSATPATPAATAR